MKFEPISSQEEFLEKVSTTRSNYIIHLGAAYTQYSISMYRGKKAEHQGKVTVKSYFNNSYEYVNKEDLLCHTKYNFAKAINKNAFSRIIQ